MHTWRARTAGLRPFPDADVSTSRLQKHRHAKNEDVVENEDADADADENENKDEEENPGATPQGSEASYRSDNSNGRTPPPGGTVPAAGRDEPRSPSHSEDDSQAPIDLPTPTKQRPVSTKPASEKDRKFATSNKRRMSENNLQDTFEQKKTPRKKLRTGEDPVPKHPLTKAGALFKSQAKQAQARKHAQDSGKLDGDVQDPYNEETKVAANKKEEAAGQQKKGKGKGKQRSAQSHDLLGFQFPRFAYRGDLRKRRSLKDD